MGGNVPAGGLRRTSLHGLHLELGARMVPFAGYEMPVQYRDGIISEHLHTRTAASLFDVSHMGQILVAANSGNPADAALALERVAPIDILGLNGGRQRYGLFTDTNGGILDDFMVARHGAQFLIVANASRKTEDVELLATEIGGRCGLELLEDRALIAIQGPSSGNALEEVFPGVTELCFMETREFKLNGSPVWISCSGYTGEDGFEISVQAADSERLFVRLLEQEGVMPAGLGARDSLRLEAGLCLYGNDIDDSTSPVEAALGWMVPAVRRRGGQRMGGFPGDARILSEIEMGAPRRRVGIRPEGRAPMRRGTVLHADRDGGKPIGEVTSGGYGPTVGGPVSMGYVGSGHGNAGATAYGEVRGRMLEASFRPLPFVGHRYIRQGGARREVH